MQYSEGGHIYSVYYTLYIIQYSEGGHMQYAAQAVVRMTSPPRCKEERGCPAYPPALQIPPTFKGPLTRTI